MANSRKDVGLGLRQEDFGGGVVLDGALGYLSDRRMEVSLVLGDQTAGREISSGRILGGGGWSYPCAHSGTRSHAGQKGGNQLRWGGEKQSG